LVYQGFLLTLFGLLVGLLIAMPVVLLQKKYGLIMITRSLAYPVEFRLTNVLLVVCTIMVLGYLAAKLASAWISARLVELSFTEIGSGGEFFQYLVKHFKNGFLRLCGHHA
jgi:lipoprotein-releasing system permease protein